MKKLFLTALFSFLLAAGACAQCFRLTGCDSWVEDEPIFASRVCGRTATLVVIAPDDVDELVIYWGDRHRTVATRPLPVVLSHTYPFAHEYMVRVKTIIDGEGINYINDPALIVEIDE